MSTHELKHLGMNWTGASRLPDGRRVLLGENPHSHRVWSVDPVTGLGEPMAVVEIGTPRRAAPVEPDAPRAMPPAPTRPPRRMAEATPDTDRGDHGPFPCRACGEKRLYRLRFANDESLTKCLNCGELVVDGQVERTGRPRRRGRTRMRRAERTATLPLPFGSRPQDDAA